MFLEYCSGVFSGQAVGFELGMKWGAGSSRNIILSAMMRWGVLNFYGVLIFNFLTSLLF